jgi:hypothetical protein
MLLDIRNNHHEEYEINPGLREKRLAKIRLKYSVIIKNKELANK